MTSAPSPQPSPAARAKLEAARRALLDLSRRNRLLNFKPRGHGSLRIVDELPDQVYRLLVEESKTLQFLPIEDAPKPETPTPAAGSPVPPAAEALLTPTEVGIESEPTSQSAPDLSHNPEHSPDLQPAEEPPPAPEPPSPPAPIEFEPDRPEPPAPSPIPTIAPETAIFGSVIPPPPPSSPEPEPDPEDHDPEAAAAAALDLAAIDESAEPHARHTDLRLQTALSGPQLQARLLHLARQAESALLEQGVSVLYLAVGLVEWTEASQSEVKSRAPLLLIPVELTRRSIHGRHAVRHNGEDPTVNPTLIELCRRNLRLELPPFDPEAEAPLQTYFARIEQAIANLPGWSLHREMHLGLFSFAKLLMYLDLDDGRWPAERPVSGRPLIASLLGAATTNDYAPGSGGDAGAPDPRMLDSTVAPSETFQVVDADSSQQAAILAAKQGRSMVIEGPPGTGKSQTITNIIAECLAEGKTVLFVAEKAAALEVVKRRLEGVGLGDFVAELHSRHANKRAFMEDLARSLARDHAPPKDRKLLDADRLADLRTKLNDYVRALHETVQPLGITPYAAIGRCAVLESSPEAPFVLPDVHTWDATKLRESEEAVTSLAAAAGNIGDPATHPWRGSTLTDLPLTVRQGLAAQLSSAIDAASRLAESAGALTDRTGLRRPNTPGDAAAIIDRADRILADPPVDREHALLPAWDSTPGDVLRLMQLGRRLTRLRADVAQRWSESAESIDWRPVADRRAAPPGLLGRLFSGVWRQDTRLIRSHLKPGVSASDPSIAPDLRLLVELRDLKGQITDLGAAATALFGARFQEDRSDWNALEAYAHAAVRLRALLADGLADAAALANLCTPQGRDALRAACDRLRTDLSAFRDRTSTLTDLASLDLPAFLGTPPEETVYERWQERLREALAAPESLVDWSAWNGARRRCADLALQPLLQWCDGPGRAVSSTSWAAAFTRQTLRLWLDHAIRSRPALAAFRGEDHAKVVERFREIDRQWLEVSRQRLCAMIHERRPRVGFATSESSGLGILEREIRRKRGIRPIRQLLASPAGPAVQRIKPCFMMSPLSVAQFLEPATLRFDVAIFDEASQVEPADALGAIARAEQVILVGDEKQLPPTNFFATIGASASDGDDGFDEDASAADLESILGLGQASFPVRTRLRWHYRSRHQDLIDFSNREFYDRDLRVFPSPARDSDEFGVGFRQLQNTVYLRGKGQHNPAEARTVAEAVLTHAREHPDLSLGVAAFSVSQQNAILDELERLRREAADAKTERYFSAERDEPLFVKNLETVQGDERDVMFLSVGYGRDENGRITMNFGPLNRDGGWRRLNVLVTRARRRCVVFTSISADDIRADAGTPRGVQALRNYLHFAQTGGYLAVDGVGGDYHSPFEAEVARRLRERGWTVDSQVGSAGFAIDLAVVDPEAPGRYLAGIECDGATYHSSATARDRDRLRQSVLEGLGWTILRIWSTDWFTRPGAMLDRLDAELRKLADGRGRARTASSRPAAPKSATESAPAAEGPAAPAEPSPPPGFVPYERARPRRRGKAGPLSEMAPAALGKLLAEITAAEGPIHRDELFRAAAKHLEARLTAGAVAVLSAALAVAQDEGALSPRGDFLWPSAMSSPPLRWRGVPDAVTDPDLIAPEEAAAVAAWVVQHEFGVPEADLPAAVVRAMGFRRVTEPLLRMGRAGADLALAQNLVARDARGLMTPPPPGAEAQGPAGPPAA